MGICSQKGIQKPRGAGAHICGLGTLGFILGFPFAGLEREQFVIYLT